MNIKLKSFSLIAACLFSTSVLAQNHIVITTDCLLQKANIEYKKLAVNNTTTLIETDDHGINALITAKSHHDKLCGGFMDVTDAWSKNHAHQSAALFLNTQTTIPLSRTTAFTISHQDQVNALLKQINPQLMWNNLTTFTSFQDRYARSNTGVQAAEWLKTQIETIAKQAGRDDVSIHLVSTGRFKQPSIVVKIGNSNESGIVIGAHLDTVEGARIHMPGADDDGSGSMTVLEAARTLLTSGMHFKKPIYIIWYAAEEEGLVGSQHVVSEFVDAKTPVSAVMHFDLTGYAYQNEPTMWLMDDYTNADLNAFIEKLISTYINRPVKHSRCGYACSDHATWTMHGFAAAIPAEAAYENSNPYMHSEEDSMDKLSLSHMTDYAKLATAFAIEAAEPITK